MDTGPEEGAVWGSNTKPCRPSQNDKLRQPEPRPSKTGIAWSLQIFHRRFGNSLETLFLSPAQLQATILP